MDAKTTPQGVIIASEFTYSTEGTPQGGVISPLLANIYLHHVLDEWVVTVVGQRLKGRYILVRYADDLVMAFEVLFDAMLISLAGEREGGRQPHVVLAGNCRTGPAQGTSALAALFNSDTHRFIVSASNVWSAMCSVSTCSTISCQRCASTRPPTIGRASAGNDASKASPLTTATGTSLTPM